LNRENVKVSAETMKRVRPRLRQAATVQGSNKKTLESQSGVRYKDAVTNEALVAVEAGANRSGCAPQFVEDIILSLKE
jgi:hypothetical protein